MKLGFIGYGNIASAIINGIVERKLVKAEDIYVAETSQQKKEAAVSKGVQLVSKANDLIKTVETIFICVKPQDFSALLEEIKPLENSEITYVSVAAGITIEDIEKTLGNKTPIVRVMPNTPLMLGCGTSALCRNDFVQDTTYQTVWDCFACAGTVYEIPENVFNQVLNLNGSAPAYVFLFANIIAQYADEHGIPYETGMAMFSDTLKGSAEMLQHSGKTAGELITAVCSPGGTTIAAFEAMQSGGLVTALRAGCDACVQRAEELAGK